MSEKPKSKPITKKAVDSEVVVHRQELSPIAATPDNLLMEAVKSGSSIDHLEKLMGLQERWMARVAREEYFKSFSKFQSMAPDLLKNKEVAFDHKDGGGKTRYKYQELGDIAKHIREPLSQCGLSYRWEQEDKDNNITVTCIVSHIGGHQERGQPLSGSADISGKKNAIQSKASTISYLRRYTLTGILGLSSVDEDNDGAGGAKNTTGFIDLPAVHPTQMVGIMKKVMSGEMTLEFVKSKCILTPDQESALVKVQPQPKAE